MNTEIETNPAHLEDYYHAVVAKLNAGECKITFFKLNGELREMIATRHPAVIPDFESSVESTRDKNHSTVCVWDVETGGWRSFVLANLVTIEEQ